MNIAAGRGQANADPVLMSCWRQNIIGIKGASEVSCHPLTCPSMVRTSGLNRVISGSLTPQCMVASPTLIDSKLAHGFASRVAFGNFPALTSIEHGLAAKHGTLGVRGPTIERTPPRRVPAVSRLEGGN
jgi:hypothetical protein